MNKLILFLAFVGPMCGQVVNQPSSGSGSGSGVSYCAPSSASGTTYTCAPSPAVSAYAAGITLAFVPDVAGSGGATTVNVNSLGAKSIKQADGSTNPSSTTFAASTVYTLVYDGTVFRISGNVQASTDLRCDLINVAISSTNWSVTVNGGSATTTALSAALSQTLTILTLPAHSAVYTTRVYEQVKFAGVTTLSVSGGATTTTDYFPAKSLVAAACSTPGTLASTCVQFNPLGGYAITDASHSFTLTFISTGTNINTLSAGSVDVSLCRGVVQ